MIQKADKVDSIGMSNILHQDHLFSMVFCCLENAILREVEECLVYRVKEEQ
jgi:hypothetical protein